MEIKYLELLTTVMFLISGVYKLIDPSLSMKKLAKCQSFFAKHENILKITIILAGLWEIIACLRIYYGSKKDKIQSLYSLVLFTILATLLCHFPPFGYTYYPFISNVTTAGGLLSLIELIKNN